MIHETGIFPLRMDHLGTSEYQQTRQKKYQFESCETRIRELPATITCHLPEIAVATMNILVANIKNMRHLLRIDRQRTIDYAEHRGVSTFFFFVFFLCVVVVVVKWHKKNNIKQINDR